MDIKFKFSGEARVYGADIAPTVGDIEGALELTLRDELGIYSDIVVTDYADYESSFEFV